MKKVFFLCFLFSSLLLHAGRPVLKVHKGNFKIVQFTDVHWSVGGKYEVKNDSTLLVMNAVLDAEKPDLVVFTGDVVVSKNALEGWERVLAPVELRKIPFAVTFGNHDTEADVPTTDVLAFIAKRPYNVTTNAGGGVEGVGNCVLPVRNEKGDATAWNLFLFDSHAYTNDSTLGYYDWIKKSQVDWFVAESNRSAAKNKRNVPALAFFHIPVPEYEYVRLQKNTVGNTSEKVCSPLLNSGLFFAFMQQQNVKATFVGHDHNNDFVGSLAGIKLCYGRKTGFLSYGILEKGARVIEINENGEMNTHIRTLHGTE